MDIKLPYVIWRDGRPRFQPSSREQKLGFKGKDLRHADGRWFSLDEARAESERLLGLIKSARESGKKFKPAPAERRGALVKDLLDDWLKAIEDANATAEEAGEPLPLSPDTISSYKKSAMWLRFKPESRKQRAARRGKERAAQLLGQDPPARAQEEIANVSVAALDKIVFNDLFGYLKKTRGHHAAVAGIATLSAAYTWGGLDRRWRLGANPRHQITLERPAGRIVIYSDAELRALIAAADALGRFSIGDSIMLGLFTCQRQRDRVFLKDEGLIDGRRQFRQSKSNKKLVPIRETPQLAARLEAARARVAALKLKLGTRPETIIVDEHTGETYNQDTYRHVYAEVRALAVRGPCPSLADKKDQDLRDTGVTWLARADNTLPEICAISGHSLQSAQTIIRHYLGSYAELADSGIDKLVAWMAREGIAV